MPRDYGIGSDHWPGLGKLVEEMCELGELLGKMIGSDGPDHWMGDLIPRLQEEASDVLAALAFFCAINNLDKVAIDERANAKITLFMKWHKENLNAP